MPEFDSTTDAINDYLERLSFYLEANEVTGESKKRAILLTVIGQKQFRLLKDLSAPDSPSNKSFEVLCQLLKDHHSPAPPKSSA